MTTATLNADYSMQIVNFINNKGWVPIPLEGKVAIPYQWQQMTREQGFKACGQRAKGLTYGSGGSVRERVAEHFNVGVVCGVYSNLCVVDIDVKGGGLDTWRNLITENVLGGLSSGDPEEVFSVLGTFTVKTGSGGYHYYFNYKGCEDFGNSVGVLAGIDIRTEGGQVVAPYSIHPDTKQYYLPLDPLKAVIDMPQWLHRVLTTASRNKKGGKITSYFQPRQRAAVVGTADAVPSFDVVLAAATADTTEAGIIGSLLEMLDDERANNYDDWIQVCFALKSAVTPDNEEQLCDLWHVFSERSPKYTESECDKVWNQTRSVTGGVTIGSLRFWARERNLEAYNALFAKPTFTLGALADQVMASTPGVSLNVIRPALNMQIARPADLIGFNGEEIPSFNMETAQAARQLLWSDPEGSKLNYIMFNPHMKKWFVYSPDDSRWNVWDENFVERKTMRRLIKYYEKKSGDLNAYLSNVAKLDKNPDNEKIMGVGEVTLQRLRCLLGKLKTRAYIRSVMEGLRVEVARVTIFKPFHRHIRMAEEDKKDTFYNTFPGFKAVFVEGVDFTDEGMDPRLKKLLNHIKVVCCSGDEALYKYMITLLSHPIRTLTKPGVVNVMVGKQGAGKSIVYDFLQKYVYGDALAVTLTEFEPMLQRFNGVLLNKLLVVVDETADADHRKFSANFNKFKGLVTNPTLNIEYKGAEMVTVENFISFAINSNQDIPVKMEGDDDRRIFINRVGNDHVGDKVYFDDFVASCLNQEVGNLFYTYCLTALSTTDNNNIIPLVPTPRTAIRAEVIAAFAPKTDSFFDEVFVSGTIPIEQHYVCKVVVGTPPVTQWILNRKGFYEQYKQHCKTSGFKSTMTLTKFSTMLNRFPNIIDVAQRSDFKGQGRLYCSSIEAPLWTTTYTATGEFPPIDPIPLFYQ